MLFVTSILLGLFLGSVPSGLWIGRSRGVDLRTIGSQNTGATNAYRALGARWGVLVFALDAAKGFLAAAAPALLASALGLSVSHHGLLMAKIAGGIAAIVGHVFSPWLRFRGGRGVATSLGVFLAIVPVPTLLAFAAWIALFAVSRRVSVGSIGAALIYPFLVFFAKRGDTDRTALVIASGVVALLVILRHKANIARLLSGKEPPLLGRKGEGTS